MALSESPVWCLEARRQGKATKVMLPVTGEITVLLMHIWVQVASAAFWIARTGPRGGDPVRVVVAVSCSFLVVFPTLAHAAWQKHSASEALQQRLAQFDLTTVQCANDFDKNCIHEAIITWYGSLQAFTDHIRGPFRLEVIRLLRAEGTIPIHWISLLLIPILNLSFEGLLALWKASAPSVSFLTYFMAQATVRRFEEDFRFS